MKQYESEGRTVEEAINLGLEKLSASISDVDITVIHEGSKGLFGLFGSRMAKVRLTLKQEDDVKGATRALFADALDTPAEKPARKQEQPKQAEETAAKSEEKAQSRRAPRSKKPARAERQEASVKEEQPKQKARKERKPAEPKEPPTPAEQKDPATKEGKAQAFLQQVTSLMGVDVSVHVLTDEEGAIRVTMQGDALGILIGRRGETLDALQYLTSLQVNKGEEEYTRVTLDSEGYRAKREEALIRLANRMANRAKKTGRRVSMEPMNPYERRILHSALQGTEGVSTHSEGEEPNRHVVITVNKDFKAQEPRKDAPKPQRPSIIYDEDETASDA